MVRRGFGRGAATCAQTARKPLTDTEGETMTTPTMRPIMTAEELKSHKVDGYGRDYNESDDGYSDMTAESERGWHAVSGWGLDGWDLGDWPYVVVSVRHTGAHEMMVTCEGDRTVYAFDNDADRDAAIDYLFVWYGLSRGYDDWAVEGLTYDKRAGLDAGALRVPERFRGSFSWARLDAAKVQASQ